MRARTTAIAAGVVALSATFVGAGSVAQAASDPAFPQYTVRIALEQVYLGINSNGDILGTARIPNTDIFAGEILPAGSGTPQWLTESHGGDTNDQGGVVSFNDHDQAVGGAREDDRPALFWPGGNTVGQGIVSHPGGFAVAQSINNNGEIVGYASPSLDVRSSPFDYRNGKKTDLPTINGRGQANAINDNGLIVGSADTANTPDGSPVAVSWQNGRLARLGLLPGGTTARAVAVNRNGTAVGVASVGPREYPAIFDHGTVTAIHVGDLDGEGYPPLATAINSSGTIGGSDAVREAFVYQNGVATEINSLLPASLHVDAESVTGINDAGVIVGNGVEFVPGGPFRVAYELTPVRSVS